MHNILLRLSYFAMSVDVYGLGIGQPREPNSDEYVDPTEDDLADLQQFESDSKIAEQEDIGTTANRWGSPKSTTRLDNIWRDGIPKTTQKQTA